MLAGFAFAVTLSACGGGSSTPAATETWEKFRHDFNNSGTSGASVNTPGTWVVKWAVPLNNPLTPTPTAGVAPPGTPGASSPAVAMDGTIYVGSRAGTLAAINPTGTIKWQTTTCSACPAPDQSLGSLVSSPAVQQYNNQNFVMIGSMSGKVYVFQDTGPSAACSACFAPDLTADFGSATVAFVSSPTFTTTSADDIDAILIGARIETADGVAGKFYAVNRDGSLRWEFPAPSAPVIGPITSSPATGIGSTVYFTASDADSTDNGGALYALTSDGRLKWQAPIRGASDANFLLASSPVTETYIYVATASGEIFSFNPADGSPRWEPNDVGDPFIASLALGGVPVYTIPVPTSTPTCPGNGMLGPTATPTPTFTYTPTDTFTPTGTPPTATPTPPLLFGVTQSGQFVAVNAVTGKVEIGPVPFTSNKVISSPALSSEFILIVGDVGGTLYALNTQTGEKIWQVPQLTPLPPPCTPLPGTPTPTWTPVPTLPPILSSPALGSDGTVYFVGEEQQLYAVGIQ